ncbi:MAG: hypothetical protein ACUZ8E_11025 [Candidatus Anammoxibacter sp.]
MYILSIYIADNMSMFNIEAVVRITTECTTAKFSENKNRTLSRVGA